MSSVGKRIRLARAKRGVDIEYLAISTGIDERDLRDIENDRRRATDNELKLIARALDTTLGFLKGLYDDLDL